MMRWKANMNEMRNAQPGEKQDRAVLNWGSKPRNAPCSFHVGIVPFPCAFVSCHLWLMPLQLQSYTITFLSIRRTWNWGPFTLSNNSVHSPLLFKSCEYVQEFVALSNCIFNKEIVSFPYCYNTKAEGQLLW